MKILENIQLIKISKYIFLILILIIPQIIIAQITPGWEVYNTTNSKLPHDVILSVVIDQKDNKWIGTLEGLSKFDGEEWTVFNTSNSNLPEKIINTLVIDEKGNTWIGTDGGGLAKFNDETWTVFNTANSNLPNDVVASLAIDKVGKKWIGTDEGLAKFDGTDWTIYNKSNSGLPANFIWALTVDEHGNIWIGAYGGGLVKFDGTTWKVYNPSNSGLPDNDITFLYIDSKNNKWIGFDRRGLAKFDGTNWAVYNTANSGLPFNGVRSIIEINKNIWIGTDGGGVAKFDGNTWIVYNIFNSGLINNRVWPLAKDSKENIWIGTYGGGLIKFNGKAIPEFDLRSTYCPNIDGSVEALTVHHVPNPVDVYSSPLSAQKSDLYRWRFSTEVKNNLDVMLQITNFEFYFFEEGEWISRNAEGRILTSTDFTDRYSDGDPVVDGWIQPGKVAIQARSWITYSQPVPPRSKWTYTAKDKNGNNYYVESEVELIPAVEPTVSQLEIDSTAIIQISGKVTTANKKPSIYTQVRLQNFQHYSHKTFQTKIADKSGRFTLESAKPGLYRLFIYTVGHDRLSIPLILDEKRRKLSVNIQPAPLKNDEQQLPLVDFGNENSVLQKIWALDRMVQKGHNSYKSAMKEYCETHENMQEFRFDWSETVAMLKNYMQDQNDLELRQYAAIQLGQLPTSPGDIDSEMILKIVEILPPSSNLWSAAPYIPSRLANQYGMAMQQKFLKDFAESNPDRVVRAMSLAQLAMMAHFGGDKETAVDYYEKLKTAYGDVEEIQHQLLMLNPDKRIIAGEPVPDFEVKLMDKDETISNKSLLGRFYLLDFWAVWCAPCVQEMENLHAVYEKFKNKNFSILSLSFDHKVEDVRRFRQEKWKMPWLNAFIEEGFRSEFAKKFEVFGIPKPILVGPGGLILEEGHTLRGEALERTLSKYLEGTD